jgi:hypothetical protein
VPYSALKNAIEGAVDLKNRQTTDWRRLIWSKYALGDKQSKSSTGKLDFRGAFSATQPIVKSGKLDFRSAF